ncbi:helix-turn-helix domain-containing protein [Alkalicoccus chagannorensis]|uniref:helix-turn-helix domain-containing protein n=1 Tax=Alkalicoccus chagannorensis TaxID=427072 RepID=UPI0003FACD8F|nr:helix-turn-helix domain-containing protein [Alkalicoccus chagannorensis]
MNTVDFLSMITGRMNGMRTAMGAVHLLRGKRSGQSIQDASLFQLNRWYGSLKHIPEADLQRILEAMKNRGDLMESDGCVFLGETGRRRAEKAERFFQDHPYHAQRWEWNGEAQQLWMRLSLAVQLYSWRADQQQVFYPVYADREARASVRHYWKHHPDGRATLYRFLYKFMNQIPQEEADLFVFQLSGSRLQGRTLTQMRPKDEQLASYFLFRTSLHRMLHDGPDEGMEALFPPVNQKSWTESAEKTRMLLQRKCLDMDQLAEIRQLKRSTIEDHLVELAISDPDFPIRAFLPEEKETVILRAKALLRGEAKLKKVKESVQEDVDYFQIRLTLARQKKEEA